MRRATLPDDTPGGATASAVSFVGAGPGDPDLLTVRGLRALQAADVVLHDALGCARLLDLCPRARLVAVGKRAGARSTAQADINRQLVAHALLGLRVVRLKGGDPTVFGRLDEEIDALVRAGIGYEIIPGITAASAAAAAGGTSLTRRGLARSVVLTTPAVGREEAPNPDWVRAADAGGTVVVYMAGRALADTARAMLAAGFAAHTPILIAYAVSQPEQSLHTGTLAQLAASDGADDGALAHRLACSSGEPCVLLVGPALRSRVRRPMASDADEQAQRVQDARSLACTVRRWPSSVSFAPNSPSATRPCSMHSNSSSKRANASA